jgi:transcription initiation factor TFIID subunit 2
MQAFKKLFCFPGSTTPLGNDFNDFQQYFVKCTIPQALARIKDASGDTRNTVKTFLIKILKFNDNSNNDVRLLSPHVVMKVYIDGSIRIVFIWRH